MNFSCFISSLQLLVKNDIILIGDVINLIQYSYEYKGKSKGLMNEDDKVHGTKHL